ncbi:response regulator [Larkinella soli]|uniref:response regulator n=1 Tax=Larkinella soli TaxID=1770527 RepID=UPI000FFC8EB0|nr:response regulator transcription factor [Larkinella soli]
MSILVQVYEDNPAFREALTFLIQYTDGFEVAGAFGHCLDAEKQVAQLQPDVILMDIDLPEIDGIRALVNIRQRFPHIDVLMLTVFDDDDRVFESIRAGATGYLLKKTSPARIMEAIREVYEGGAPMSPSIARRVMQSMHRRPGTGDLAQLTERETEILSLLSRGKSYKMVASETGISIETVRTHIKRIYEKLHVHSVTEAISKYLTR